MKLLTFYFFAFLEAALFGDLLDYFLFVELDLELLGSCILLGDLRP